MKSAFFSTNANDGVIVVVVVYNDDVNKETLGRWKLTFEGVQQRRRRRR